MNSHEELDGHAIPAQMKNLPLCPRRGLPIPYVNAMTSDGRPDFAVLDSAKVRTVAERRLCGVCAEPLGYWMAFVGGPRAASEREYVDPPMHPDSCAPAALRLCPWIARESMWRLPTARSDAGFPSGFTGDKPEEFVVYLTRGYRHTLTRDGVVFRPHPAKALTRYHYVEGRLTPR